MPGRPLTRNSQRIIESLTTTSEWWEGTLDKIACGDNPKSIAEEYAILFGVMLRWIEADAGRKSAYEAALRIAAEGHAHDCITIADEQKEALRRDGTPFDPDVGRDKLRIETRLKLAGAWRRDRYGEKPGLTVNAGAGSLIAILSGIDSESLIPLTRERDVSREFDGEVVPEGAPGADLPAVAGAVCLPTISVSDETASLTESAAPQLLPSAAVSPSTAESPSARVAPQFEERRL